MNCVIDEQRATAPRLDAINPEPSPATKTAARAQKARGVVARLGRNFYLRISANVKSRGINPSGRPPLPSVPTTAPGNKRAINSR